MLNQPTERERERGVGGGGGRGWRLLRHVICGYEGPRVRVKHSLVKDSKVYLEEIPHW